MNQSTKIDDALDKLVSALPDTSANMQSLTSKPKEPKITDTLVTLIVNKMEYAENDQKHRASQIIINLMAKMSANKSVFDIFKDPSNIALSARLVTQIVNLDLPFAAQEMYYVIKRGSVLCLQISYYGLMEIAYRAGVYSIRAETVFDGDDFDFHYSNINYYKHTPSFKSDVPLFHYATCKANGEQPLVVMSEMQMQKFKHKYSNGNPVWNSNYIEMAKKTVITRMLKMTPKTSIIKDVLADNEHEGEAE